MKGIVGQAKQDYIWNTAAGLINAAEAVIMSMIVTRVTGLADAGILSIAFAIGNLLMPVGKFGLRSYQATDIENQFSFSIYLKARVVTVFLMIVSTFGYMFYAYMCLGYNGNKMGIIVAVCMIYAVEAVEDVIWGYYQRRNRLDAGAKLFCYRWIGILIVFPIALYISRDLRATLAICFVCSLILFAILVRISFPVISAKEDTPVSIMIKKADWREIGKLLRIAFPLFGISFLSFYVNNAPKYAIDACLTDEIQACYGFVAMPVFAIRLLNNFIYQPILVPMAVEWDQGRMDKFVARVVRQIIIVAGISIVCIAGAYVLGIPVLSMLYNTDLSGYKSELIILIIASGFLAGSSYLSVVLTVMRCQKALLWPYCLVSLMALTGLKQIVSEYGTIGASVCYLTLMIILCFLYSIIFVVRLRGNKD